MAMGYMTDNKKNHILKFFYLSIFGIAFAFIEAAVVVYLRQLYYPQGFQFPLSSLMPDFIYLIEIFREFSTIIIIVSVAFLCGKRFIERFAYFLYIFAIWDIFYYVFLKVTLGWPSSILTWDLLFLIPVPWTSPVLFPIICSVTMIVLSILLYNLNCRYNLNNLSGPEWGLLIGGAFIVFISFIWEYVKFIFDNINLVSDSESLKIISAGFAPGEYHWEVFIIGEIFIISAIVFILRRSGLKNNQDIKEIETENN